MAKKIKKQISEKDFDYKNIDFLSSFMTERAKIINRKYSGLSAKQQRRLAKAVKRARHLGLLPYQAKI